MFNLQPSITAVKKFFRQAINKQFAISMLFATFLICGFIVANSRSASDFFGVSAAPIASPTPKPQGCCSSVQPTLRRMIGTYYSIEDGMTSTLTLNNKGPHPIDVTPILYNLKGQRFVGSPVTVNGESSLNVEFGILAILAGPDFKKGSFEFTYLGRMMEMGGGLRIIDERRSLIFDEQMLEPGMKFSSPQLEAVYSIPFDSAQVNVIVSNKTDKAVAVKGDAGFAAANGHHPIIGVLKPRETNVVMLPQGLVKKAKAGSVSLSHDGGPGALMAIIHIEEPGKGFSASVNFADPGKSKTNQYHGAGLRLGSVNGDKLVPIIAVRNLSDASTVVTGRIPFTTADGSERKIELRKTELAAGETKLIEVLGLPSSNISTAGLELEHEGAPGSVIADALSVSANGNQVFTLPLKDPKGGMSSTGGYPWFITDSSSTIVFIKNTTAEARQFHLTLSYQGGKWGSNLKTIAPGQTVALDVKKIRDEQEKGSEGNAIPPDVSSGHVAWSVRGGNNKVLIGRAQTVDFAGGMASTYECQCLCGSSFSYAYMSPGSVSGYVGDTQQFASYEVDTTCYGGQTAPYQVWGTFSSNNTNVATINSSGLGTAQGEGSTYLNSTFDTAGNWYWVVWQVECAWEPLSTTCSASCEVQVPTISIGSVTWNHLEIHPTENATLTVQLSVPTEAAGKKINVSISQAATTGTINSYAGSTGVTVENLQLTSPGNTITHTITNSTPLNNGTVTFNASLTSNPNEIRIGGSNPTTSAAITLKPAN